MNSAATTFLVRVVGDRGLVQNLENVPDEMACETAEQAARRLMTIDSDEGRVEIEINGESVEPELIGYWRMLAREALEYPDDFDRLVRSLDSYA